MFVKKKYRNRIKNMPKYMSLKKMILWIANNTLLVKQPKTSRNQLAPNHEKKIFVSFNVIFLPLNKNFQGKRKQIKY